MYEAIGQYFPLSCQAEGAGLRVINWVPPDTHGSSDAFRLRDISYCCHGCSVMIRRLILNLVRAFGRKFPAGQKGMMGRVPAIRDNVQK